MAFMYFLGSVGFIILSIFLATKAIKRGTSSKKAVYSQIAASFVFTVALFAISSMTSINATSTGSASGAITEAIANSLGMGMLSVGITMGLTAVGTGIAVASAAPAAIAATSEDPKNFTKSLIFVAMGEGILVLGIFMAFMILTKIDQIFSIVGA